MSRFVPSRVMEIELSRPLPALTPEGEGGLAYGRALVLVRLHAEPLGILDLPLGEEGLDPEGLAGEIWSALEGRINAHLQADGLKPIAGLGPGGLRVEGTPRCTQAREELLEGAPFISVVVSTRDRPDLVGRLLPSLLGQAYPRYEVVLVDNAPATEETHALYLREWAQSGLVRYVREGRPGLARARNRGVREAKGEIVAFTDDDAVADRLWLEGLARGFGLGEQVGCVTGLVVPLALDTPAQAWYEEFGGFGKGTERGLYDLGEHRPGSPLFPYAAGRLGSGNNMAFRRGVLGEIGGFDEALGAGSPTMGGEDLAAFVAVLKKGYALVYEPGALVWHEHRRDYAGLERQVYGCGLGLTAYLTSVLLADPKGVPGFLLRVPAGLRYAADPSSAKNRHRTPDYPVALRRAERQGMLRGPLTYLQARWKIWREEAKGSRKWGFPARARNLPNRSQTG